MSKGGDIVEGTMIIGNFGRGNEDDTRVKRNPKGGDVDARETKSGRL